MKKLFTLLTMLVVGIGSSWADDFTPDANAEYTLQCCATDHSGFIGLNNGALDGRSAIGTRFKFESATGGYYIKVVDANKYFNWNNNDAVLSEGPSTVWEVTSSTYIPGKYRIAPSGTASNEGLNNNETNKATHLKIGPFNDASNACSHWTIRAITIPSNCNAYIGGVTTGNYTIDETKWKTQGNWSLTDTWKGNGPGCNGSDMWSPIYLQDITSGTIPSTQDNKDNIYLEGWTFRMTANHSTFTINQVKKIQSDCYLTLKNTSVVTMNFGNGQQNPFTVNLNEGTGNILNFVMTSSNFGSQITLNYGDVTKNSNRKFNASASSSRTINRLIFSAALTDPTEDNTVESIPLAEFANNVTITNKTFNISGTDGWTEVGSEAELSTQFINGKYYYVEDTATGVKLHTYKETTKIGYTVAENSTETLSQIDNYENYDSYTVPSNSTLIIDIDDFNLKRIYGTGNIGITSGKTLVVSTAGFDLTRITGEGNVTLNHDASLADGKHTNATGTLTVNEGVKLSMGSGQTTNASVKSFSNVVLMGTLHFNTQKNELNNLTVPENKTGVIFSYDMNTSDYKFELKGTTTINTGAKLITCNRWKFKSEITKLAGSGVWEICGTTGSNYAYDHQSKERSLNTVLDATTFTGTINLNNVPSDNHPSTHISTVTVEGNLVGCTLKKTTGDYFYYSGANLNGTTLEGVILNGSARINTSNTVNIKNLAGNNLSNTTNNYALVGTGTLNLEGDCDFTKKSDNSDCDCANIGYRSGSSIVIKSGANVKAAKISYDTGDNAAIIVEGTLVATKLHGDVTLVESSVTTLSDATPFNEGAVTVSGNATLNLSAANITLNQPITIASGKTLTIDGASTAAITLNSIDRSMAGYTFTNCTSVVVQFTETGAEYAAGGFTITNIPSGVTVKVKKYGATDYETVIPVDGTATISHSVEVSGSAAWLDYTFNESTKSFNIHSPADKLINNAGNAGSGNNLNIDGNYTTATSYNDDGTLKVMSTPYRGIDWPTNYTVAVAGNVPDVENGCLVAFGSSTNGSNNYLAIIRGASQNEIKLVKGHTISKQFEVISTMSAANATALSHLVVFTKNGNTFTVYLDGVQKTQVTYSETLGGGFQIGSVHGGVNDNSGSTGIVRVDAMDDATAKAKVFAKTVRVYDYVISDDQMSQLTEEFQYTSFGGTYSRTISANGNLSASNAWLNKGSQGNVDVPVNAVVDEVTYYPDVEVTTTAASTLTVNADMDAENITFDGTGKLTIVSDGEHNIHIYGSLTANGPISVKYGETNLSAVPVTIGESGSVEFDFSASDFSGVTTSTDYPITGNTSDYGNKVTGVYPSDTDHTFTITHKSTTNSYYLTVGPSVAFFQQQAIDLVTPYYNGQHVGTGLGKYTISLGETSYANFYEFGTAVMSWASLEDCVEPTIAINQPTSGYYQIKSKFNENTGYYLSYDNDNNNDGKAIQTTTTDAKNIFYIEVGNSNSSIKSYSTGFYFGNATYSNYTSATNDPIKWTFSEGANKGTYTLTSTYSGSNILYGWSGASSKSYADRNATATGDGHTDWILIPIAKEDLPVIEAPGSTTTNPVILGNITSTDDVTGKIDASATFVDLSDATISASIDEIKAEVEKINSNAIIIAPEGTSVASTTTNVLLTTDTENTYTCNNLQLNDDVIAQFTSETNFTNTKVTYSRAATASQWGTIYLPYDPEVEEGVTYYELTATEENYLKFTKVDNPEANTPYMYKKTTADDMSVTNTSTSATFALGGDTDPHKGSGVNNYHLVGILTNSSIVENDGIAAKAGYNKIIDPNAYYFKNTDNTFRPLPTSNIFSMKAFRCYLTSSTNARQNVLGFSYEDNGQPTGVSIIESEDGNTVDVIFDLNGRRLQNAKKGINIINGKKVIK